MSDIRMKSVYCTIVSKLKLSQCIYLTIVMKKPIKERSRRDLKKQYSNTKNL